TRAPRGRPDAACGACPPRRWICTNRRLRAGRGVRAFEMGCIAAVALGLCGLVVLRAAPVQAADDDVPTVVKPMDSPWAQRDAADAMPDTVTLGTRALAIDPNSYDVQWRLARAYFWVAYTQSNRVVKKAMAAKAMEAAHQARKLQPNRVEAQYYYAIAVG